MTDEHAIESQDTWSNTCSKNAKKLTLIGGSIDKLFTLDWWHWKSASCDIYKADNFDYAYKSIATLVSKVLVCSFQFVFNFACTYPRFHIIQWLHRLYPSQNGLFIRTKINVHSWLICKGFSCTKQLSTSFSFMILSVSSFFLAKFRLYNCCIRALLLLFRPHPQE